MSGVNKVILIGRLGKDPEVRHLEGGATVASFPLATSESYTNKEGVRSEQTEWHNIVVWRGLAEIAEKYLSKGKQIYVEGKLRTRNFEKNGEKRYVTEIVADNFQMLDRRPEGENGNGHYTSSNSSKEPAAVTAGAEASFNTDNSGSDDLPF